MESVNVFVAILNKAGEPEPPIASQKMWRPETIATGVSSSSDSDSDESETAVADAAVPKPKRQARGRTVIEMQDDNTDPRYVIQRRHIW